MWEVLKQIFTYPLIDWNTPLLDDKGEIIPDGGMEDVFTFTGLNIILIAVAYLIARLFIKYVKRYFNARHLTDKQLKIEGKEIAIWRLTKQLIYLLAFYTCFLSLKINNPHLNLANLLGYEFFRIGTFHIAVYHIFLTLVIVFIARLLVNFMKVIMLKAVKQNNRIDGGTQYIYVQLIKYLIYSIAIITLLRSFGIDLDLFLTATTFLLVGVGLGLQSIFRDYFSGILLLLEGSIKVGDVLELESYNNKNFVAKVVQINLRTSKVETRNEKILVIPNSKLTHERVINWSAGTPSTRFNIPITFHYGVDTDLVRKLLVVCAERHPKVHKTKKPFVRLLNFGDYGLEMDLVFWAKQDVFIETTCSEIRFEIDKEIRRNGITIPYPQTDIHLNPRVEKMNGAGSNKDDGDLIA